MNSCYAIYRLPDTGDRCFCIEAEQATVQSSPTDIDDRSGFVIAPFEVGPLTPVIFIQGEAKTYVHNSEKEAFPSAITRQTASAERACYHDQFALFHDAIVRGECNKIVLARRCTETSATPLPPHLLFQRACESFPHCFVALYHTPQTGTWLTATPEILLEQTDGQAHTMALAGTMPAPSNEDTGQPWSPKNRREQQYVADYIRSRLQAVTDSLTETDAHTFVAGNVMHLRSDFHFTIKEGCTFGSAVRILHPTPAVCGTPTSVAHDFILAHEQQPRAYYSGYCGPTSRDASHLFVMLRCMNIRGSEYDLYAGGGLVEDSTEQEEWEETENKLFAMRHCLNGAKA